MRYKRGFGRIGAGVAVLFITGVGHAAPLPDPVVRIQPVKAAKGKPLPVLENLPQATVPREGIKGGERPLPEPDRLPAGETPPLFEPKGLRG